MKEFDSNFAHTVYFWLANPDQQEDRTAFETSLRKFLKPFGLCQNKVYR